MKGVCWPDPLADSPLSTARRKITSNQREFPHSPWNQDITRLLETGLARELPPSGLLAVSWLCLAVPRLWSSPGNTVHSYPLRASADPHDILAQCLAL